VSCDTTPSLLVAEDENSDQDFISFQNTKLLCLKKFSKMMKNIKKFFTF
jgi:hypothetical protein